MTREEYIKIGGISAIENEARFEKIDLWVSQNGKDFPPKHYGLYGCFTPMTQHTYGTKEELLFILGVMSSHKNEMETNTHEFYKQMTESKEKAYAMADDDTIKEMLRIANLENVEIDTEKYKTRDEIFDQYFDNSQNRNSKFLAGNYFYHFRIGKVLLHRCEIASGVKL